MKIEEDGPKNHSGTVDNRRMRLSRLEKFPKIDVYSKIPCRETAEKEKHRLLFVAQPVTPLGDDHACHVRGNALHAGSVDGFDDVVVRVSGLDCAVRVGAIQFKR